MKKIVRRSGFTLPEVLVTVTVVAVLAAVVVPAVTQFVSRGNGPASQTDISAIQNAITGFITDCRVTPGYLSDLTGSTYGGTCGAGGSYKGPYLQASATSVVGATGNGYGASGTQAGTPGFTSQGLGLQFADTIISSTGTGKLQLLVVGPSSYLTNCATLESIDKSIDDGHAGTGNFTFGAFPSYSDSTCVAGTGALLTVSLIGQ